MIDLRGSAVGITPPLAWLPAASVAAVRPLVWIDACQGEPVEYARMIDDLRTARVVYLGERHTIQRHHDTQARLIAALAREPGVPGTPAALVVALEPLESSQQASIDRFNCGEIDFDGLAAAIDWALALAQLQAVPRRAGGGPRRQGSGGWPQSRSGDHSRRGAGRHPAARAEVPPATSRGNGFPRFRLRKDPDSPDDGAHGGYAGAIASDDQGPDLPRRSHVGRAGGLSAFRDGPWSQGGCNLWLGSRGLWTGDAAAVPAAWATATIASSCWPNAAICASRTPIRRQPDPWRFPTSSGAKPPGPWRIIWRLPARSHKARRRAPRNSAIQSVSARRCLS